MISYWVGHLSVPAAGLPQLYLLTIILLDRIGIPATIYISEILSVLRTGP